MTTCPHCTHSPCHKHGKTKSGHQRYKCPGCGKVHSESGLLGRPTVGDRPMTGTERMRRSRANKKKGAGAH